MKKIVQPKECFECPFLVDTYTVSYKSVDDGSSYCLYYDARIGGEMADEERDFDDAMAMKPWKPSFCRIEKITIEEKEEK